MLNRGRCEQQILGPSCPVEELGQDLWLENGTVKEESVQQPQNDEETAESGGIAPLRKRRWPGNSADQRDEGVGEAEDASGTRQCSFCGGAVQPDPESSSREGGTQGWQCVNRQCHGWYGWVKSEEEQERREGEEEEEMGWQGEEATSSSGGSPLNGNAPGASSTQRPRLLCGQYRKRVRSVLPGADVIDVLLSAGYSTQEAEEIEELTRSCPYTYSILRRDMRIERRKRPAPVEKLLCQIEEAWNKKEPGRNSKSHVIEILLGAGYSAKEAEDVESLTRSCPDICCILRSVLRIERRKRPVPVEKLLSQIEEAWNRKIDSLGLQFALADNTNAALCIGSFEDETEIESFIGRSKGGFCIVIDCPSLCSGAPSLEFFVSCNAGVDFQGLQVRAIRVSLYGNDAEGRPLQTPQLVALFTGAQCPNLVTPAQLLGILPVMEHNKDVLLLGEAVPVLALGAALKKVDRQINLYSSAPDRSQVAQAIKTFLKTSPAS